MWIWPVSRSTILVLAEMNTPIDSTEPVPTITPSTTSERAPMKQLSSTITGLACNGSSTPPMPTPPDRWQFLPICAHEPTRSEEHTSELQSLTNLVCRLLLEKKKKTK